MDGRTAQYLNFVQAAVTNDGYIPKYIMFRISIL